MADKQRIKQFERYPKYKENYLRAIRRFIPGYLERRAKKNKPPQFKTAEGMFDWWIYGNTEETSIDGQIDIEEAEE